MTINIYDVHKFLNDLKDFMMVNKSWMVFVSDGNQMKNHMEVLQKW